MSALESDPKAEFMGFATKIRDTSLIS